ncbi:MAG: DUF4864 domain-containing protein [Chthoniobacterales bacterium]
METLAPMTRPAKASLLLFFFSLCGVAFVVTHHVRERIAVPAPHELFAVVNEQLAAFRSADFPSAYRQATSGVQQKFTLPQFESMVRRNYAEITQSHRVEFGSVKVEGGTALVQVFFFAEDGSVRAFLYSLVSEDDRWKVGGVEEIGPQNRRKRLAGMHV